MIYDYFSKVQRKLEAIKWIIIEQSVNFDFVSDEIDVKESKKVNLIGILDDISEKVIENLKL